MPWIWSHHSGRSDHAPQPVIPRPVERASELSELAEIRYLFERLGRTTCAQCGERIDAIDRGHRVGVYEYLPA